MLERVDPATLRGALICIPVLNASAFEARQRVSPIDHLDVNRLFPGDPGTTYTPRLAHLVENLALEHADVLIDLHGGGNDFRVTWYTIFHDHDNDAGRLSRELSLVAGAPLVWASQQVWLERGLFTRLTRAGVAAMLIECGGEGRLYEENIRAHEVGLLNMLRHLRMIDGDVDHVGERTLISSLDFFHCTQGGFITAYVKPGDDISKGQPLLQIRNEFGREVEVITSSADNAVVIAVKTYGVTNGGAPVGQIALKA
jgi:predicted deacylase